MRASLDEIEKAHPDSVIPLQVVDHGKLTDAQGRTILEMSRPRIAGAKSEMENGSIGLAGGKAGDNFSKGFKEFFILSLEIDWTQLFTLTAWMTAILLKLLINLEV